MFILAGASLCSIVIGGLSAYLLAQPSYDPQTDMQNVDLRAGPPFADDAVANFARDVYTLIASVHTSTTLDTHMERMRPYLTATAEQEIRDSLQRSGTFESGYSVTVAFPETPVVESRDVIDGVWNWVVSFPADLAFTRAGTSRTDAWTIRMRIQPREDHMPGVAQIMATPR